MSKRQKRLQRLRQNTNNVSLDTLRQVLEDYGFQYKQSVGSHYTFTITIANEPVLLVIPFNRPIKSIYVKRALQLIDQIIVKRAKDEQDDE